MCLHTIDRNEKNSGTGGNKKSHLSTCRGSDCHSNLACVVTDSVYGKPS